MVASPGHWSLPQGPASPPPLPSAHLSLGRVTPVPAHSDDVTAKVVTHHSPGLAPLFQPHSSSVFCLISSDFYVFVCVSRLRFVDSSGTRKKKREIKDDREEEEKELSQDT
ncbi:hypothetical protein E2C01_067145 [Portunus trituberculatus]|uniref:Uncharacterized protein n=1 Tax=Portunus trituberculatus TaxID=210409 RepID=A0A5B7HJ16_PORTR|nr:hypothetical protein [Portunus trituberculatus]